MIGRVVTMLAILVIAVITTAASAHAARMSDMQMDHAAHQRAMVHAASDGQSPCDGSQNCASSDATMCDLVCAGPSVFLSMQGVEAGHAFGPADLDIPAVAIPVGLAPGPNERPPKLRLL